MALYCLYMFTAWQGSSGAWSAETSGTECLDSSDLPPASIQDMWIAIGSNLAAFYHVGGTCSVVGDCPTFPWPPLPVAGPNVNSTTFTVTTSDNMVRVGSATVVENPYPASPCCCQVCLYIWAAECDPADNTWQFVGREVTCTMVRDLPDPSILDKWNVSGATAVYYHVGYYCQRTLPCQAWYCLYTYTATKYAPTLVSNGNLTLGIETITGLSSTAGLLAGMTITGIGIRAGVTIFSVDSGSQVTMTAPATAGGTVALTFCAPPIITSRDVACLQESDLPTPPNQYRWLWTGNSGTFYSIGVQCGLPIDIEPDPACPDPRTLTDPAIVIPADTIYCLYVLAAHNSYEGFWGYVIDASYRICANAIPDTGDWLSGHIRIQYVLGGVCQDAVYCLTVYTATMHCGTIESGTTVLGHATITGLANTAVLFVGQTVTGDGIPADTAILTIDSGSQVTLTAPATASGTVSCTFYGTPWTISSGVTTLSHYSALPEQSQWYRWIKGTEDSTGAMAATFYFVGPLSAGTCTTFPAPKLPLYPAGPVYLAGTGPTQCVYTLTTKATGTSGWYYQIVAAESVCTDEPPLTANTWSGPPTLVAGKAAWGGASSWVAADWPTRIMYVVQGSCVTSGDCPTLTMPGYRVGDLAGGRCDTACPSLTAHNEIIGATVGITDQTPCITGCPQWGMGSGANTPMRWVLQYNVAYTGTACSGYSNSSTTYTSLGYPNATTITCDTTGSMAQQALFPISFTSNPVIFNGTSAQWDVGLTFEAIGTGPIIYGTVTPDSDTGHNKICDGFTAKRGTQLGTAGLLIDCYRNESWAFAIDYPKCTPAEAWAQWANPNTGVNCPNVVDPNVPSVSCAPPAMVCKQAWTYVNVHGIWVVQVTGSPLCQMQNALTDNMWILTGGVWHFMQASATACPSSLWCLDNFTPIQPDSPV